MTRRKSKLFIIGASLAVFAFTPALGSASGEFDESTDGNQAAGDAASYMSGSGNAATSIGALIQGGSQNVAVGASYQSVNGSLNTAESVGGLVIGGTGNTSIGSNSQVVDGSQLQAIGHGATSGRGDYNTAIGSYSYAGGISGGAASSYNTAIGYGAQATMGSSVAIGAYSVADRPNSVSVGQPGYERQITNVAPGYYDTDAVNMSQLRNAESKTDRVGALAFAFSALAPMAYDPKEPTQYSAGLGTYSGTTAVAIGVYHYTRPEVMLNAAIAMSNNGWEKSARVGITWKTGGAKRKELIPAIAPAPQEDDIVERVKKIMAEYDHPD